MSMVQSYTLNLWLGPGLPMITINPCGHPLVVGAETNPSPSLGFELKVLSRKMTANTPLPWARRQLRARTSRVPRANMDPEKGSFLDHCPLQRGLRGVPCYFRGGQASYPRSTCFRSEVFGLYGVQPHVRHAQ